VVLSVSRLNASIEPARRLANKTESPEVAAQTDAATIRQLVANSAHISFLLRPLESGSLILVHSRDATVIQEGRQRQAGYQRDSLNQ
jgi:hypothetical protein